MLEYIDLILSGFFIGAIIAVLLTFFNKVLLGSFVKALIKSEATTPYDAKSFDELNMKQHIFLKIALRKNGMLRRIVTECTDETDGTVVRRFYIPGDKLYRAQRMYGRKDADFLVISVSVVILLAAVALFSTLFPAFTDFLQSAFPDVFSS